MVLYARNLIEFIDICHSFDIDRLPEGRTIDDLIWIQAYRTEMILVNPRINNTGRSIQGCECLCNNDQKDDQYYQYNRETSTL